MNAALINPIDHLFLCILVAAHNTGNETLKGLSHLATRGLRKILVGIQLPLMRAISSCEFFATFN